MIRIFLGNVGSGKTISAVREMILRELEEDEPYTFSNIITKKKGKHAIKKNILLAKHMLLKEDVIKVKSDGSEVTDIKFNLEFWKEQKAKYGSFNIVLDEAHTLINARMFASKQNKVMNDFMALIRKICTDSVNETSLTLISQLDNRIDINARQLATEVRYHVCLYNKTCLKCNSYWLEHSEIPHFKKLTRCPKCGCKKLKKYNYRVIVHYFDCMKDFENWKYNNSNTISKTSTIKNIDKYFNYYNTLQYENLIN